MVVFGAGGVGLSAVLVGSKVCGARVIAVDTNPAALAKAKSIGAAAVLDASTCVDDNDVRAKVIALCGGEGADLSVDAAGFTSTCENAVWCARRGGRMVQVGLPLGGRPPAIPMARVAAWELELIGSHGISASDFADVLKMVERGL